MALLYLQDDKRAFVLDGSSRAPFNIQPTGQLLKQPELAKCLQTMA